MDSSSATTWLSAVRGPWPISTVPVSKNHAAIGGHLHCRAGDFVGSAGILHAAAKALGPVGLGGFVFPLNGVGDFEKPFLEVAVDRCIAGGVEIALLEQILQANIQRINAEPVGNHIHLRFIGPGHLQRAKPAEGTCWNGIGVNAVGFDFGVGYFVRPQ